MSRFKWLIIINFYFYINFSTYCSTCCALTSEQERAIDIIRSEEAAKWEILHTFNKISLVDAILISGRSDISKKNHEFIQDLFWDLLCTGTPCSVNDFQQKESRFKGLDDSIYPPTSPRGCELIDAIFTRTLDDHTNLKRLKKYMKNNQKQTECVWVYSKVFETIMSDINEHIFTLPNDLISTIQEKATKDNTTLKGLTERTIRNLIEHKNLVRSVTSLFDTIIEKRQHCILHQMNNVMDILKALNFMTPLEVIKLIGNAHFYNNNRLEFFKDIGVHLIYTGKFSQQHQNLLQSKGIKLRFSGIQDEVFSDDSKEREELIKLILGSNTLNLSNPFTVKQYDDILPTKNQHIKKQAKAIDVFSQLRRAIINTASTEDNWEPDMKKMLPLLINTIHKASKSQKISKHYIKKLIKAPACIRAIEWFYNE